MKKAIQKIYEQVIVMLSPNERLQLASLILNDLVEKDATLIDEKDIWTEEDQQDLIAFSLQYVSHDN
ncbi:UNVERIFIED_CONTAM: hypothetical protein BEN50_14980 [Euhalothece sp. KZN 001]